MHTWPRVRTRTRPLARLGCLHGVPPMYRTDGIGRSACAAIHARTWLGCRLGISSADALPSAPTAAAPFVLCTAAVTACTYARAAPLAQSTGIWCIRVLLYKVARNWSGGAEYFSFASLNGYAPRTDDTPCTRLSCKGGARKATPLARVMLAPDPLPTAHRACLHLREMVYPRPDMPPARLANSPTVSTPQAHRRAKARRAT